MDVLIAALLEIAEPLRLIMLFAGVLLGLTIGVIPGIGGLFGLTILVPLTYTLDPVSALALLLGMSSVTTTSDTVPAVLLGVPGTVGSAATVIDGHEMAKQGRAAEALGAAYAASLVGGVFGALFLAMSLPIMRYLVLLLNYGDLLAITIFGLTLVALLSRESKLRGLLAMFLGILVSLVGLDPYEGAERWTMGNIYFWSGFPTAIVFLGLFGLSELASLAGRGSIQRHDVQEYSGGLRRGISEALRNWRLVLKTSAMGSMLGAVPGIGVTIIEWIAYGSASRNPGDGPAFGKGNIRGVIGPESANNAKEGGALLPTLAFGIPGSATMAILLGAFAIHGLIPGPQMLETDAPILVSMILMVAIANVVGALICLGLTPQLAKVARVPATIIVPISLTFVCLGAFHTNKEAIDILVLLAFGAIGLTFKAHGWSRPAFALGFVLAPSLERYFVITYQVSGWNWLTQPFVIIVFAGLAYASIRSLLALRQPQARASQMPPISVPNDKIVLLGVLGLLIALAYTAWPLPFAARLLPLTVCVIAFLVGIFVLFKSLSTSRAMSSRSPKSEIASAQPPFSDAILKAARSPAITIVWNVAAFGVLLLAVGHLLAPLIYITAVTWPAHGRKTPWKPLAFGVVSTAVVFILFNVIVQQSWPTPWLAFLLR